MFSERSRETKLEEAGLFKIKLNKFSTATSSNATVHFAKVIFLCDCLLSFKNKKREEKCHAEVQTVECFGAVSLRRLPSLMLIAISSSVNYIKVLRYMIYTASSEHI